MKWASCLLLMIGPMFGGGCRQDQEPERVRHAYMLPDHNMAIYEARGGVVLGASMAEGKPLWRYQPDFKLNPYLDYTLKYQLICPVLLTPSGNLILRYGEEIHAVALATGELIWMKDLTLTAQGSVRCPAATPDSGVLLFRQSGLVLEKRDYRGKIVWNYDLISVGMAAAPPQVNKKTGDALLVTTTHLLSISPRGSLNWAKRRDELIRDSEAVPPQHVP